MWQAYPFGALSLSSDWACWSLERIALDGVTMASQLHCDGLVVAECLHGVAVLSWPPERARETCILLVAFAADAGKLCASPAAVSPERFLQAKGFTHEEQVIACAVSSASGAVTAQGVGMQARTSTHGQSHSSALFRSSANTQSESLRY